MNARAGRGRDRVEERVNGKKSDSLQRAFMYFRPFPVLSITITRVFIFYRVQLRDHLTRYTLDISHVFSSCFHFSMHFTS